jgi:hypothetical protein
MLGQAPAAGSSGLPLNLSLTSQKARKMMQNKESTNPNHIEVTKA